MSTEQKKALQCKVTADNFTATATMHSGSRRRVTVRGSLTCPTEGFKLSLETDNPGTPGDPHVLVLKVVEKEPNGVSLPVLTETEVSGYFPVTPEVEAVEIRTLHITVPVKNG
ncbi:hypothetical protein ACKI1I_01105 [Streptomyces turgidiscabies]|uniref:hypothetical protein n=1 Tax=Streptomyces TaxID=1883 RepID=UPI00076F06F4|nr:MULTISPECIES: hypothetical protein [Streptomyces]MDX3492505.1 hypothetical protein [Streptomyces turgidiscabies]GAQ69201.1 hypothetical protein T45_00923 [Streptomyces turgidiscabies]